MPDAFTITRYLIALAHRRVCVRSAANDNRGWVA